MTNNLYETAHELLAAGIHTIPVRADGSKAPVPKSWQKTRTTEQDIETWFGGLEPRHTAMGIVTGDPSGRLEMFEVEGRAAYLLPELADLARDSGLGDLWVKVCTGWTEQSPSGGIHWFIRISDHDVPGNTKLATRPATPGELEENPKEKIKTLAETRGTGGQVVAAPTPGSAHTSPGCGCAGACKPWARLSGGPATMPTLTWEERDAFAYLLATIHVPDDASPSSQAGKTAPRAPRQSTFEGTTPGDDFENKTTWAQILEPTGWTQVFTRGSTTYWRRPGKPIGISATTGHADDRDRLYVFSSSTEFETETSITKLHAYTILNHGGDHSAAARALRKQGFGEVEREKLPKKKTAPSAASSETTTIETDTATITVTGSPEEVADLFADSPMEVQEPSTLGLTDDANAARLVETHGDRLRFNVDTDRWLFWNGQRWIQQTASGGQARELAKQVARSLPEDGPEGKDKHLKHKRYTLSANGITALLTQARTDPNITISSTDLDAYPWELNTPTGTIDLRTGETGPADPTHLHTRMTLCGLDPSTPSNLLEEFLRTTLPDPEIRQYVQRLIGYSAIGVVREHLLPFCYGTGGNGKGVLLEAVKAVLGNYAGVTPAGFLMTTRYEKHETEKAKLSGLRYVICAEVNEKDKFDEAKVKGLSGGDTVTARFMRQDHFDFAPTHQLWLMGNYQPDVESGGPSFWRRLRLIPFQTSVAEEDIVEDLQGILAREFGPAVLAWIVDGARQYTESGLLEPSGVRAATDAYAADVDTVGRFLDEECYTGPSYKDQFTPVTTLRAAYETWCNGNGETIIQGRAFTSKLSRHGVLTGRDVTAKGTGGARLYGGVLLKSAEAGALDFGYKDN